MGFIKIRLDIIDASPFDRQIPPFIRKKICLSSSQINNHLNYFNAWLVVEGVNSFIYKKVSRGGLILLTCEPSDIKSYNKYYIKQFDLIISTNMKLNSPNIKIIREAYLPWLVGRSYYSDFNVWGDKYLDFDELYNFKFKSKLNKLCIITSSKNNTPVHSLRVNFVNHLKASFGDAFDIYGQGFIPVVDKLEILSKYKYCLVIENSVENDYWSEKLSDALIAYCQPIYFGCPNINKYFKDGVINIDISKFKEAEFKIKDLIKTHTFDSNFHNILVARDDVFFKYNIFNKISEFNFSEKFENKTVFPESFFKLGWLSFLFYKIIDRFIKVSL